ncbi:MAG: right-handed parallel beta-helix repeat-containing protein, partial [Planctomycetota bacterium]
MYSLRQILVLASIFVVVVLVGSIRANEVHVIHPTGEFPADVVNVQTVVDDLGDRGVDGKIILEARNESGVPTAFNFGEGEYILGERGYVDVLSNNHIFGQDSGDIEFVGVRDDSAQTTIVGGLQSISCWRRTKFEVRGIRFEGAEAAPIFVFRCDSCEIKDNEIWDVRGDPFGWGTYGEPKAVGIWIAAYLGALDNIRGHVEIKDNHIYDVVADSADGMAIVATNASFEISGNEIHNVNRIGIFTIWNQKPVVVEKNLVIPGPGNTPSNVGNNAGYGIMTNFPIGD